MNTILITKSTDPWHNLALEELLFNTHREGVNLFLWQNQNTVVIGRHQNAWKECRIDMLEREGGKLARRSSGGGAVFHDLGNLNFTFTVQKGLYDQSRQLGVIIAAVRSLGIEAGFTGRNDIVAENGAKFSGNAFRHGANTSMHHGTILVDVDMDKLGRYLLPSAEKLRAKGVESVRARVCNLSEFRPDITIDMVSRAVQEAFQREYGSCALMAGESLAGPALDAAVARYASWEWRCGASPSFDVELSARFPWGGIELALLLENGKIREARVYSDAMDEAFIAKIPPVLAGIRFKGPDMAAAIGSLQGELAEDIARWLSEKSL